MRFDPLHDVIKELGWRGVLVEPMAEMFALLQQNYDGCAGLTFVNKAIADFDGDIEMTRVNPQAVDLGLLPEGALGITTLMPERGVIGKREHLPADQRIILTQYLEKLTVPCCLLQTLLDEQNVDNLDLLFIDAEGADWMIARQLPLDRYQPHLVYLEFHHLPIAERRECVSHFIKYGYRTLFDENRFENMLAIRIT